MSASMSKLEYLKKYMSSSKKEELKVKKKKLRPLLKAKGGIRIVDEEIDLKKIAAGFENDEDQIETQEDAPFVAGVIDDRSDEMKVKQDFIESSKWKRLVVQDVEKRKPAVEEFKKKVPAKSKKNMDSDSDPSPQRRTRHDSDSDASPPRRSRQDAIKPRKRHDSDSDQSPPRRHDSDSDASPPRKKKGSDSDPSPPRRRQSDSDPSPPRRKNMVDSDGDLSPERPQKPSTGTEKMTKTLDGKRAGLQTGRALREEAEKLKKKEEEAFKRLDKTLTGQNAATAVRAGKLRDIEAKQQAEREKAEKVAKLQEAYQKWNKGIKQGADQSTKLAEDVYEMTKPLARFAGDDDLEQLLKEQDREGDPMAAYMAKKKMKSAVEGKGKAPRPVYRGPAAAPNRFGILPGYRWDGVDRSTGYEKMCFEKQNSAVALREEAYKWSVSDM